MSGSDINLNNLTSLVGDLNASDMLEGETLSLEPFRLITDGSYTSVEFLHQNIWDNDDNRGDDDASLDDVKKHIKEELGHILNVLQQIDIDELLK